MKQSACHQGLNNTVQCLGKVHLEKYIISIYDNLYLVHTLPIDFVLIAQSNAPPI